MTDTMAATAQEESLRARTDDPAAFLKATYFLDHDHPTVAAFAEAHGGADADPTARAVSLYYAVRDGIRYDPYMSVMLRKYFRASTTIEIGRGFCIPKAAVLAAACRYLGIPARPGYGDVVNHLATKRFLDLLGSRRFVWHGYVELHLGGRWVKCTPAFNKELCEKFNVHPLEFDGTSDSMFQPFDAAGNKYMDYVHDHGTFVDVPFAAIEAGFRAEYPKAYGDGGRFAAGGDFYAEAEAAGRSAE